jgi:hypothetical protein
MVAIEAPYGPKGPHGSVIWAGFVRVLTKGGAVRQQCVPSWFRSPEAGVDHRSAVSERCSPRDKLGTTRYARCRTTCTAVNVTHHALAAKTVGDLGKRATATSWGSSGPTTARPLPQHRRASAIKHGLAAGRDLPSHPRIHRCRRIQVASVYIQPSSVRSVWTAPI